MEVVVKWSLKGRALLALFVPFLAWLSWYSFNSDTQPSPAAGVVAIAGTLAALVLQVHLATYRVVTGQSGFVESSIFRTREVAWADVVQVDGVAQASHDGKIHRWAAAPEDAFHVIVHTRQGRISVHRWMTGVDDFIEALRVGEDRSTYRAADTRPIDRKDPTVAPVVRASPAVEALGKVHDGLQMVAAAFFVIVLSVGGGLMVASSLEIALTGNLFVDGLLLALAPWGLGYVVYKWVARERRRRFGPEHERPPIGPQDLVLTMAAALIGPALLYGFVPRALANRETVDFIIAAAGAFCCWVSIAEVRRSLRSV